jgi:hypothetical protein
MKNAGVSPPTRAGGTSLTTPAARPSWSACRSPAPSAGSFTCEAAGPEYVASGTLAGGAVTPAALAHRRAPLVRLRAAAPAPQ